MSEPKPKPAASEPKSEPKPGPMEAVKRDLIKKGALIRKEKPAQT